MNSRVMLVLAVLLIVGAAIAGYLGYKTTQDAKQAAEQAAREAEVVKAKAVVVPGKVPVVVAVREIPAYKTIAAEDVALDYIKVEPPYTFRATEDLVGQVLQVPIKPGTLISQEHLQPGSEIARLLKPGERAVAIAIDEVVGGGGFVQPGDIVDVLLFAQGDNRPSASAQVVMRALRVVGFGIQLIGPEGGPQTAEAKDGKRAERQRARTAVLAVEEKDVTRLMLASSIGTLRLAIRPASEAIADAELAEEMSELTAAQQAAAAKKKEAEESRLLRASAIVPSTIAERQPAAGGGARAPARPAQPPVTIFRGLERGN
ncbi:MAG: Flp pilus assembly protein CpaB [Moraxellaceae bacterium]|nr:Flp pilus assembly protein CpaB [Moraxellaceae bacterium]MDZ4387603.1 Flp pilus assembly protein CpaB [Moraxellaceae bacterium]